MNVVEKNITLNPLPIDTVLAELRRALSTTNNVVLHAPPGAGKTTRVPLSLLDLPPLASGRIIMLEPRRLAAVHAATRMARTCGEQVGETVGYSIRFDRRCSGKTRIEVVTEGILTRRLQGDPCLEGVAMVIFDEFHERSLQGDLAIALCLEVQRELRPDLKILVMSATLDCGPIAALLGNAPVVASTGRAYPVDVHYLDDARHAPLPARISAAIRRALAETEGDILAFLPGAAEIRACHQLLHQALDAASSRIFPLYGDLPFPEQERALLPASQRKIVLATNIAETSLTIEGVRVVIDSGLSRMLRFDPGNGLNRLVTVRESKASAEQRRGRAGRLAPGVCYRLFGRHTYHAMTEFSPPEITVADLAPLLLELAVWGVQDPAALSWIDPPPASALIAAHNLLRDLGALDRNGLATETGRKMAELPVHPRLARLLERGRELDLVRPACCLAALLSERDIFRTLPGETAALCVSDLLERYETLRQPGQMQDGRFLETAVRAVERTSAQLTRLMGSVKMAQTTNLNGENAARLLLAAYPDRVARQREEGSDYYLLATGRGVRLSAKSGVRNHPLILAVRVDAGEKGEGLVHLASALTTDIVREECPDRIMTARRVAWDAGQERVAAWEEDCLGAIALARRQQATTDEEARKLLVSQVSVSGLAMLRMNRKVRQFQGRVRLVRQAMPEREWPDIDDERLLATLDEWLAPFLHGRRSGRDLAALDILSALQALFSWEQLRLLDELAPTHLTVPSGNRIEIDYTCRETPPLVAVKLQEMFGLAETPTIANGRVQLVLQLLSPAQRPVQITRDLKGFWENAYGDVKRELKGRYPKHPWPDDPWHAVPTRLTNRMLSKGRGK